MSILDQIIGIIVPHDCLGCGAEGSLICDICAKKLIAIPVLVPETGYLRKVTAVTAYKGIAKDIIWKLKFDGAQAAATLMAAQMALLLKSADNTIIVPAPTATSRIRQRSYDQARLLARGVARQALLPYVNCLARYSQAHQVGASREQRLRQITGTFRVTKPRQMRDKHIILVDDVITTGATLEAAAEVLIKAGACSVQALTFAYAQPTLRP